MIESEVPDGPTIVVGSALPGAGTSVTVAAIAGALAVVQRCAVLDVSQPACSPWPHSVTTRAACGLPLDPPTSATLESATSRRALLAPACAGFDVLTDWGHSSAGSSRNLAWWLAARAASDWPLGVVDAGEPLLTDPVAAGWCHCPGVVTALVVPTTRPAAAAASRLLTKWESGLPVGDRVLLAPVDTAPGRRDGTVLAELSMLERRVAATAWVPYDAQLHRRGIAGTDRMGRRASRAYVGIAEHCLRLLHAINGTDASSTFSQEVR